MEGLGRTPKSLPSHLFYDEVGSHLFEKITELLEYYPTRAEREILETHASAIAEHAGSNLTLIELGAGTASKTRLLIAALLRRQLRLSFYPVDVSPAALEIARQRLGAEFPRLAVTPLVADYTGGFDFLPPARGRNLVLYLGSSIGNFEPEAAGGLLRNLRRELGPGDYLLLGTDMLKKASVLVPAYNDTKRITAQFNLNLLARINRELGGHFDLHLFRHLALWNPECSRIEMYLESTRPQMVAIDALGVEFSFAAGERIHTENSYKYTQPAVDAILTDGGFHREHTWTDRRGWFALHLARVAG
jgi:L-histidine N-alpha-methyltransferase